MKKVFKIKVTVQYRDIDSAGHVNNAIYLHFLEELRMEFLKKLYGKYNIEDIDFVLAGLNINYHSRATFRETLIVEMHVTRIGKTSWTFVYTITEKKTKRVIVEGESVQVLFDYEKAQKRAIPNWLKKRLQEWL